MVDTLQAELNGFEIDPGHGLTIVPPSYTPSTGEILGDFQLWKGQHGRCAYRNEPGRYQFTVDHRFGKTRAVVQLSLPRYGKTDNLNPLTKSEAKEVVKNLQRDMDEIGVGCNVEDARLSRVDAFKNLRTQEKFETYTPILSLLEGRRMRSKTEYGGEGITWASSVAQVCAYDKIQEMKEKKIDITPFKGENIVRFELRSLKHKKVEAVYGWQTVFDLVNDFDSLPGTYSRVMKDSIFRYQPQEIEVLSERQVVDELEMFKRTCGRRWAQVYERECGIQSILKRMSIETYTRAIETVSGCKVKAWRHKQSLQQSMVRQKFLTESAVSTKNYGQLYSELRTGVLTLKAA